MARILKLTSFSCKESVLINGDEITIVRARARSTASISLRDGNIEHVLESVETIERMLNDRSEHNIKTPKPVNSGPDRVNGGSPGFSADAQSDSLVCSRPTSEWQASKTSYKK